MLAEQNLIATPKRELIVVNPKGKTVAATVETLRRVGAFIIRREEVPGYKPRQWREWIDAFKPPWRYATDGEVATYNARYRPTKPKQQTEEKTTPASLIIDPKPKAKE